jgi:hypothetical protein
MNIFDCLAVLPEPGNTRSVLWNLSFQGSVSASPEDEVKPALSAILSDPYFMTGQLSFLFALMAMSPTGVMSNFRY